MHSSDGLQCSAVRDTGTKSRYRSHVYRADRVRTRAVRDGGGNQYQRQNVPDGGDERYLCGGAWKLPLQANYDDGHRLGSTSQRSTERLSGSGSGAGGRLLCPCTGHRRPAALLRLALRFRQSVCAIQLFSGFGPKSIRHRSVDRLPEFVWCMGSPLF